MKLFHKSNKCTLFYLPKQVNLLTVNLGTENLHSIYNNCKIVTLFCPKIFTLLFSTDVGLSIGNPGLLSVGCL